MRLLYKGSYDTASIGLYQRTWTSIFCCFFFWLSSHYYTNFSKVTTGDCGFELRYAHSSWCIKSPCIAWARPYMKCDLIHLAINEYLTKHRCCCTFLPMAIVACIWVYAPEGVEQMMDWTVCGDVITMESNWRSSRDKVLCEITGIVEG